MSILIEYENGQLKTAEMVSERIAPSPSYLCKDGKTFCVGDLFDVSFDDLSKMDWQTNPIILNEILGTKGIARAEEGGCAFAVDLNGWDTFFYYFNGSRFVLSDNFWDIVKRLEPTYEDLDIPQMHRYLIARSTAGKTFIKNLYILKPSQIGFYDAKKNTLTVRKFQEFRYSGEITDVVEAADRVDAILHDGMKRIREKCGDVQYGLGLSGGMDSRLVPHYAKAHGLRLTSFNTCIPRPHKILLAQSIVRAQELARVFDIPFRPVHWRGEHIKDKMRLATRNSPLDYGAAAFKYEPEGLPAYDIHLTGTGGVDIGCLLPLGLPQRSEQELTKIIIGSFFPACTTSFSNRAKRALGHLLGRQVLTGDSKRGALMTALLTEEDYAAAEEEVAAFVAEGKKQGKGHIDIFEDYLINVMDSTSRPGAHESAIATKRAFSIYIPFILRETLNWKAELLEDRAVLNELIRRHVPEVADVKAETFLAAANDQKPGALSKALTLMEFLLRGNGTAINEHAFRQRRIRKLFIDEMNENRGSWFHKAMGICDTVITEKMVRNDTARAAARIWQFKDMIDCIEKKEYLAF